MFIERVFINDKTNEKVFDTLQDSRFEALLNVEGKFSTLASIRKALMEAIAFEMLKDAFTKQLRPLEIRFYLDEQKKQLDTVMYLNTADYYGMPISC